MQGITRLIIGVFVFKVDVIHPLGTDFDALLVQISYRNNRLNGVVITPDIGEAFFVVGTDWYIEIDTRCDMPVAFMPAQQKWIDNHITQCSFFILSTA